MSSKEEKNERGEASESKHQEAKGGKSGIIQKVCDFYYDDDNFIDTLTAWAFANCHSFAEGKENEDEYSLECTELHRDYCDLVEQCFEGFLREEDCTISEFYRLVKEDTSRSIYSGDVFTNVLLAATDFRSFMGMMRRAKRGEGPCNIPPLQDLNTGELSYS